LNSQGILCQFHAMKKVALTRLLLLALLVPASQALAESAKRELLLVGGGQRPEGAMERFVRAAGGSQAEILVITWATEDPAQAFESLRADFLPHDPAKVIEAERRPLQPPACRHLLAQLHDATAVFFSGGDQNKIMEALGQCPAGEPLRALHTDGMPIGGTSAGTAVISALMFSGRPGELVSGQGLLSGTILDTHFLRRHRESRLAEAVLAHRELVGIGIDEDNAVWMEDGVYGRAIGPAPLTVMQFNDKTGRVETDIIRPGKAFKLPPSLRPRLPRR
jgi:cyanophycinase